MQARSKNSFFGSLFSKPNDEDVFFDVELDENETPLLDREKESVELNEVLVNNSLLVEDEDTLFDLEEEKEDIELSEVIVESSLLNKNINHAPKKYLFDEVNACIELLKKARINVKVNEDKLNNVQHYYRRRFLLQNLLSLSSITASLSMFLAADAKQSEQESILDNLRGRLRSANSTLSDERMMYQSSSYNGSIDNVDYGMQVAQRDYFLDDWWHSRCDTWKRGELFISRVFLSEKMPTFDGENFCNLQNKEKYFIAKGGYKSKCSEIVRSLCDIDQEIFKNKDIKEFDSYLNAQYEVSNIYMKINRNEALYSCNENRPLYGLLCSAIVMLSLSGIMVYFYYNFIKAYREYKEDLSHAADVDRCIDNPSIAERIINLAARMNINLKDKKIDDLIDELQQNADEIYARRRVRLAFVSVFQNQFPGAKDVVSLP